MENLAEMEELTEESLLGEVGVALRYYSSSSVTPLLPPSSSPWSAALSTRFGHHYPNLPVVIALPQRRSTWIYCPLAAVVYFHMPL